MRHFIVAAVALLLTAPQDVSDTTALVKGNTQFALDLYATLRLQDGNLFFSPYSISTALAMTYAGAGGTTASQIARTLHFPLPSARLHPVFAALNREVSAAPDAGPSYELTSPTLCGRSKAATSAETSSRSAHGTTTPA